MMLFLKVNKHFMWKKAVVLLLVGGGLLSVQSSAQNNIKIQSTAVPFMLISPDARSGGMGNLSIAMTPEANDLFGNTAKLPLMKEKSGFLINYTPWLKDLGLNDVYLASMGYYKKLDDRSAINSSLRFFSLGNITFSDENGTDVLNQNEALGNFAVYSRRTIRNANSNNILRNINIGNEVKLRKTGNHSMLFIQSKFYLSTKFNDSILNTICVDGGKLLRRNFSQDKTNL